MTQYHDHLHQLHRLYDYRDQVSSGLFQIHRILTTYFPDYDMSCIDQMNKLLNDEYKNILNQISQEEHP
jgi:hypothetical protein